MAEHVAGAGHVTKEQMEVFLAEHVKEKGHVSTQEMAAALADHAKSAGHVTEEMLSAFLAEHVKESYVTNEVAIALWEGLEFVENKSADEKEDTEDCAWKVVEVAYLPYTWKTEEIQRQDYRRYVMNNTACGCLGWIRW